MEFRKQWDNWGWLVAAFLIVVGFCYVMYGRGPFCAGKDEHCLREWFSATSGWVAIAIAIPTLINFTKQVKDGERFFKASARIAILGDLNASRHLLSLSRTAIQIIGEDITEFKAAPGKDIPKEFGDLLYRITYMKKVFSRAEFHGVSQRYGMFRNAEDLVEKIDGFIAGCGVVPADAEEFARFRHSAIEGPLKSALEYANDLHTCCGDWLTQSQQILDLN